ncbi:MAG: 30S ribosomal protein S20 [Candidatus Uhrbacteria bacterium GW2011_GWF2_41_16]|jgi:small subunit ribosomal protein S20|uniref:Small ribosomal subunit protein bS20 n=2 Tax=Candidatus Uhriibacteriota TaxID=1752732 RepID=A0A0G0XNL4_9BACT|nr:MAG: 30S ribosomal protein S20 [Candidatus Uhrbacteria bacterium GW2011_GWA2_41_10]KKR87430.1 MAG: 30S ribosomal protein S20 [Candidatus Uhrbacteria bacterium GW2011_GWC2_41_11]KKR98385.1 MAG: 30S ribosomal protein S20 [Candidatus Uhrbacteria bacterium GW2011_GWF2_41_16]HBO99825.1 30S ribosomal protein S20 [Candidatus Uhrbacteria bacterium]
MPIKENAKKALRQSLKRVVRNDLVKAEIHSLRVKFRKTLAAGKTEDASVVSRTMAKKLDKAVSKGILKKNTASRIKSRTVLKLNIQNKKV